MKATIQSLVHIRPCLHKFKTEQLPPVPKKISGEYDVDNKIMFAYIHGYAYATAMDFMRKNTSSIYTDRDGSNLPYIVFTSEQQDLLTISLTANIEMRVPCYSTLDIPFFIVVTVDDMLTTMSKVCSELNNPQSTTMLYCNNDFMYDDLKYVSGGGR